MLHGIQPTVERVTKFVDSFIPPDLAADREKRKQARMFLFSHVFGPFIGNVVPAAIFVLDPHPTYDVVILAAAITAFWIFPFALRWFGHYDLLVVVSVQNLIFCILWSCYFYGGVTSPTLSWVVTIPLLAFFYIGPNSRLRFIVIGLFVANSLAFAWLYFEQPLAAKHLPLASLQGLGLVSTLCTAAYVMMMATYYAKILASGAELEAEMRHHLATFAELRQAAANAERAGAAKAEFLAKMTHELRTPLNAILSYSELMLDEADESGDRECVPDLKRISTAGRHLLKLINEILDLSKLEAGKMELFNEEADLNGLLDRLVRQHEPAAAEKGTTISLDASRGPRTILCDAQKLEQIVEQLLDNAVKFTDQGRISVATETRTLDSIQELLISVRDTGCGIPSEQIGALFDKFTAADDLTSSKYGGTGLGLALSQRLARLMGGDLQVQSAVGRGTCFTVRVPLNHIERLPPVPEPARQAA